MGAIKKLFAGGGYLASVLAILGAVAVAMPATAGNNLLKEGETAFNTFCVACHQPKGVGKEGVAPSLTSPEFLASASDTLLTGTIANGRPGTAMIAWKPMLGDEKISAIVAYLRSFSKGADKVVQVNSEPPAKGDKALGEARFTAICSGCHGEHGGGYIVGGSAPAIGKPGFLRVASDGYIRETMRNGRSNTRMHGFQGSTALANLSDKEIDSIISYLRSLGR